MAVWTGISLEFLEKFLGRDASARVDSELHLTDLLINLLHEVNDEVNKLVFVHLLRVEVGYQKTDVVALRQITSHSITRI